jgi:uracil-DNA glycosylase
MLKIISNTHNSWHQDLNLACQLLDKEYQAYLSKDVAWLPGLDKLLAAFSMPKKDVRYVLIGESPYPRLESANGYAFWDAAIKTIWTDSGMHTKVNRATSLRNIFKMLLIARGDLGDDLSQGAIANINKSDLIQNLDQFFINLQNNGVLLLNATLVYSPKLVTQHAKAWRPFILSILKSLDKNSVKLILWGKIAEQFQDCGLNIALIAEHPYNNSFIRNQEVQTFFKPWDLLLDHDRKK